jgi:ABC-type multidrug transport system ATPase subunit/ABC-type multidrug transport system permease subunit
MQIILTARGLCKTYPDTQSHGSIKALDHLDLTVREGEILGILGPNGAGKTTFLNTLATLLLPDEGEIEIFGTKVIPKNFDAVRRWINMSSGYPNYAFSLSVEENLKFYGRLYGLCGAALQRKVDEVIDLFELRPYAKRHFDELSSGTKQRLSLAKSLLNDPKILFLDEPTVGLDPDVSIRVREIVMKILRERKMTVLLTSHNMAEVEIMCERVAFIQKGRIIKLAAVDELKRLHHTDDLEKIFIELAHQSASVPSGGEELLLTSARQLPKSPVKGNPFLAADRVAIRQEEHVNSKAEPGPDGTLVWINRAYAFTIRSAIFAIRNLFVMTDVFFWPMISLLSIGLMTKFINLGSQTVDFVMTGTLAAGILQITQLDVGYTVLYELWSKSLKHTLLTPVGVAEGVVGTWFIGITRGFVAFVLLATAASWGFGFHLPGLLTTALFLFGLFCCAFILGILVNILILSFGQKVEITAWMFAQLFMIICGIYYPVDVLPKAFQSLALMVPITHFLEFFRQSYGFKAHTPHPLFFGFALTLLYIMLSLRFLGHAYTRARRKGVIIRLSE